jgi:steroid 5-alpha reductase family enzyme
MDELIRICTLNLGMLLLLTSSLWILSLPLRDASIIDPFWPIGFVAVAWLTFLLQGGAHPRAVLVFMLTTIWGARLAGYLFWRNWGKGEDYRYRQMRDKHGGRFWLVSLLTVFTLQAILLWFVSWPVQFGQILTPTSKVGWLDFAGIGIWLVGMFFETIGDYQLARFKRDPENKGRVMRQGLWRYTRHPNYFGDFCVWWGLYLIALAAGAWWTIVSPVLMSILLIKVSGAALLEKTIVERRPDYLKYMQTTNAFLPGPPRD